MPEFGEGRTAWWLADYVTVEDGTGLVHQAPAFGAEDLGVARRYGLPVVNPVTPDGRFAADVPLVGGLFFKSADKILVEDLRERGVLWHYEPYEHSYPSLLALRHPVALLRAAQLVHPHHRDPRPAPRGEPAHQLVPAADQGRALRRLAGQQRRLGAVAQPLLGDAAAGVALRRRRAHLTCVGSSPSCPTSPGAT